MSSQILLLFAHPAQEKSQINVPLFQAAQQLEHVTAIDLYKSYPNFRIDINSEQQRLLEHHTIIFQFPLYWYSTPALLKEWQDLVLEYGFAYGATGKALHGKGFQIIASAGNTDSSYSPLGQNRYPIHDFLRPLEQTAYLTGMVYHEPLILFGSLSAKEDGRLGKYRHQYLDLLMRLRTPGQHNSRGIND